MIRGPHPSTAFYPTFRAVPALMSLFAVLLLTGCSTLEPPDVTLSNLQLTDLTVLETSGVVTLRLANGNPEPLVVDGAAFNLYLMGRKVGKVLSDERVEVGRLSTSTLEAELHLSNLAMATRLQEILETETVAYEIRGKVWVLGDLGRSALRLSSSGDVDLGEAAEAFGGSGSGDAIR
ncbi:MAG: LEA type 2 family protein [Acidobacteriota bacterium]